MKYTRKELKDKLDKELKRKAQMIDGVPLEEGERIVFYVDRKQADNGIYEVVDKGTN